MGKFILSVALVLSALVTSAVAEVSVGSVSEKAPPSIRDLHEPASDAGVDVVGLRAIVSGEAGDHKAANLYVFVNPLSNPDTRNAWWVQEQVGVRGGKFACSAQFGEGYQGSGEFFAIVVLASDKPFSVGQQVQGLPSAEAYSKLKIVKRR